MFRNKKGFTMIELLIVIAILAVLVLFAVPRYLSYIDDANVGAMKSDAKVLHTQVETAIAKELATANTVSEAMDKIGFIKKGGSGAAEVQNHQWHTSGTATNNLDIANVFNVSRLKQRNPAPESLVYAFDEAEFKNTGTRLKNNVLDYQIVLGDNDQIAVIFTEGVRDSEGKFFFTNLQTEGTTNQDGSN